jgi:predicted PurR-regulated permease PerM
VETEIIKMAASQGLFAVLFVALLFYVLRHNERREERLMSCLERLTADVGEIKSDIEDLKEKVGA